jgi:hypothetical protein
LEYLLLTVTDEIDPGMAFITVTTLARAVLHRKDGIAPSEFGASISEEILQRLSQLATELASGPAAYNVPLRAALLDLVDAVDPEVRLTLLHSYVSMVNDRIFLNLTPPSPPIHSDAGAKSKLIGHCVSFFRAPGALPKVRLLPSLTLQRFLTPTLFCFAASTPGGGAPVASAASEFKLKIKLPGAP